jgi:hypothetical protein
MPKKNWTDEERKAFGEKMRKAKLDKETHSSYPPEPPNIINEAKPQVQDDIRNGVDLAAMQRQIDEVMETNALLRAAVLGQQNSSNGVGVKGTQLVGEVDKYLVDKDNYPDPTRRLAAEPRLQTIAFNHNYELEYNFSVRSYETKTGLNMREPEFLVTLLRVVLDDQGERVKVQNPTTGKTEDKFYIAKRLMFHEDPQAALVIARDNNIDIDKTDEKVFLDEMRYLRVRDWLFGVFWPQPTQQASKIREEVIGGTLVQVYTKNSVDPSAVDFDALQTKVQA